MPKSKQRKKAAKKAKHNRRNPGDSTTYMSHEMIELNRKAREKASGLTSPELKLQVKPPPASKQAKVRKKI